MNPTHYAESKRTPLFIQDAHATASGSTPPRGRRRCYREFPYTEHALDGSRRAFRGLPPGRSVASRGLGIRTAETRHVRRGDRRPERRIQRSAPGARNCRRRWRRIVLASRLEVLRLALHRPAHGAALGHARDHACAAGRPRGRVQGALRPVVLAAVFRGCRSLECVGTLAVGWDLPPHIFRRPRPCR